MCACYFIFVYPYRELTYRLFIWINSSMCVFVSSDIFIIIFTYLSPVFTSLLLAKYPLLFPFFLLDHLCLAVPLYPPPTSCIYLPPHSFVGQVDWSQCVLTVLGKGAWLGCLGMIDPREGKGPGIEASLKSRLP